MQTPTQQDSQESTPPLPLQKAPQPNKSSHGQTAVFVRHVFHSIELKISVLTNKLESQEVVLISYLVLYILNSIRHPVAF